MAQLSMQSPKHTRSQDLHSLNSIHSRERLWDPQAGALGCCLYFGLMAFPILDMSVRVCVCVCVCGHECVAHEITIPV